MINRWNKCVCENKKFLCKSGSSKTCSYHVEYGPFGRCKYKKSKADVFICMNSIAQKEALCYLIEKCDRASRWAGFQLSTME